MAGKRNITVNGFDLQDANFITQLIQHEQGHVRDISNVPLASSPGIVITNVVDREKVILVSGTLLASDHDDLEDRIDELKRNIGVEEVEIIIDQASTTRVYTGTWQNPESMVKPEQFNIRELPYTFEFLVTGYGSDSDDTTLNTDTATSSPKTVTYDLDGSAPAPAIINMAITTANAMQDITVTNQDTIQAVALSHPTGTFSNNDAVSFDGQQKRVLLNSVSVDYSGVFPDFDPRTNTAKQNTLIYTFAGSATVDQSQETATNAFLPSSTLDQKFEGTDNSDYNVSGSDVWQAQSFVLAKTSRILFFQLYGRTASSSSPSFQVDVYTNSGGVPGTAITGYSNSINGNFGTSNAWTSATRAFVFSSVAELTAGTTYWLVVKDLDPAGGVIKHLRGATGGGYASGQQAVTINGGSSWTTSAGDLRFRIYTDYPLFSQSFIPSGAITVPQMDVFLDRGTYVSSREVIGEIWTSSGGFPNTLVANASKGLVATNIGTSAGWVPFVFSTPPSLSAATTYHVVLRAYGQTSYIQWWRNSAGGYGSGVANSYNPTTATWSSQTPSDMTFRIYKAFTGISVDITPTYTKRWQ